MAITSHDIVPLKTGVTLEVATSRPEQEHSCTRVAFCLHPWSWLGGCMYDATVQTIVKSLQNNDFYVVYYNSRGVGRSTGWPSFNGKTEGDDLQALVQHFLQGHPQVDSVTFIGYSHGSLIATLHPVLPSDVKTSYVLLSYPLGPRGLLTMFHSRMYDSALASLMREARARLLIVHGDQDDFTGRPEYDAWTELLKATEGARAQLRTVTVTGARHSWQTERSKAVLRTTLMSWLNTV